MMAELYEVKDTWTDAVRKGSSEPASTYTCFGIEVWENTLSAGQMT